MKLSIQCQPESTTNMRQVGSEKDDPLKRIQEEINEVARRELELREKMQPMPQENGTQMARSSEESTSTIPTSTNRELEKNLQINEKESTDDHNSDDSGISASSSPINGIPANEKKYIRKGYSSIPNPPPQKLLVRAMSTPQIQNQGLIRFSITPAQKGLMQRFIESRGRIGNQSAKNQGKRDLIDIRGNPPFLPSATITPPIIERDEDGKPIRRGFIPVEEKIQRELRDLKNRETELKRLRKISCRQSQPDLLDSVEDEEFVSDEDYSDVEHCFAPGKLRSSKSIGELCDVMNNSASLSSRTPSPSFDRKVNHHSHHGALKPALSLAQLCDLDPDLEAPSSHQLIAKWESLIQQNS